MSGSDGFISISGIYTAFVFGCVKIPCWRHLAVSYSLNSRHLTLMIMSSRKAMPVTSILCLEKASEQAPSVKV